MERTVLCGICGAPAPARFPDPAAVKIVCHKGGTRDEAVRALADIAADHCGPCGRPCCGNEQGHATSARELCMGKNGCAACAKLPGQKRRILAITLVQPWAHLIVHGPKRIENRTWRPSPLRVGDYLAIHAGAWHTRRGGPIEGWAGALEIARERGLFAQLPLLADYERIVTGERGRLYIARCNRFIETAVSYGAVVGVARLAAIETASPAGDPWWCGPLGWRLDDVVAIEPVPCRGAQGLWEMPGEVYATVRAQWKAAREKVAATR